MNKTAIIDFFKHMEWADAVVWKAVLASDVAKTDRKARDYLYHLHMVHRAFLRVWRAEPRDTPYPTFEDATSLREWAVSYYPEAYAQLEALSDAQLAAPMNVPWADLVEKRLGRPPDKTTIGETAMQVVLHSMYHRGQVNARLRALGAEPPMTDYIAWIWLGRPAADWSAVKS
ncbi:MAG: DinB family protein [Acidobacteriota bacterium]